jgi:hypothetical protein
MIMHGSIQIDLSEKKKQPQGHRYGLLSDLVHAVYKKHGVFKRDQDRVCVWVD